MSFCLFCFVFVRRWVGCFGVYGSVSRDCLMLRPLAFRVVCIVIILIIEQ